MPEIACIACNSYATNIVNLDGLQWYACHGCRTEWTAGIRAYGHARGDFGFNGLRCRKDETHRLVAYKGVLTCGPCAFVKRSKVIFSRNMWELSTRIVCTCCGGSGIDGVLPCGPCKGEGVQTQITPSDFGEAAAAAFKKFGEAYKDLNFDRFERTYMAHWVPPNTPVYFDFETQGLGVNYQSERRVHRPKVVELPIKIDARFEAEMKELVAKKAITITGRDESGPLKTPRCDAVRVIPTFVAPMWRSEGETLRTSIRLRDEQSEGIQEFIKQRLDQFTHELDREVKCMIEERQATGRLR